MAASGRSLVTARRKIGAGSNLHGKAFIRTLYAMEAGGLIEQSRGSWSLESNRHKFRAAGQRMRYSPTSPRT